MAISLRRVAETISLLRYLLYLPNIPNIVASVFDLYGLSNIEYRGWSCAIHPAFEFGYRATCFTVQYYLQALECGINIHGLCYSNIVSSGSRINRHIFEICQLLNSMIGKARNVTGSTTKSFQTTFRILGCGICHIGEIRCTGSGQVLQKNISFAKQLRTIKPNYMRKFCYLFFLSCYLSVH